MRKVATVLSAIGASFALASAASAATSFSVTGPNTPGTNTYSIVFSYAGSDGVLGYGTSVTSSGTYTGAFTRTAPSPFTGNAGNVVVVNGQTGVVSRWAAVSGGVVGGGGTFTVGTIEITVAAGNTVQAHQVGVDGILVETSGGLSTTVPPDSIGAAITIIPEPTTAALLGLGLVGLVVSGRRGRA